LTRAVRDVAAGDLHLRVPPEGADELAELVKGFNAMAEKLEANLRALNERQARIQSIVEAAADGIVTVAEHGTIESFNSSAERLFGYSAKEVIGRNFSLLLADADHAWSLTDIEQFVGSGSATRLGLRPEVTGRRKNGSAFPSELAIAEAQGNGLRIFAA